MTQSTLPTIRTFDIEGQEVKCYESDGHRLWRCECAYFQRTLGQHREGFCPHTAVATMRCLADGSIEMLLTPPAVGFDRAPRLLLKAHGV